MKITRNLVIILLFSTISANSHAFPELPFCPAGGPPGWLNHFNNKRDQNTWRRYSHHNPAAYNTNRHARYYNPTYNPIYRQYNHSSQPYTYTLRHQRH